MNFDMGFKEKYLLMRLHLKVRFVRKWKMYKMCVIAVVNV